MLATPRCVLPTHTRTSSFSEAGYYYFNEQEYNDPTQQQTFTDPHQIYYPRFVCAWGPVVSSADSWVWWGAGAFGTTRLVAQLFSPFGGAIEHANVNELRLGLSNTTRNPTGILSQINRKS